MFESLPGTLAPASYLGSEQLHATSHTRAMDLAVGVARRGIVVPLLIIDSVITDLLVLFASGILNGKK